MALCEKLIKSCVAVSCDNPVFTGVQPKAYIFNKTEVEGVTYDANNGNIVTAISMATGKKGYAVSQLGKTPFTGTQTELVEGNFGNTFTNTVSFLVPDNSATASNEILDMLANGKFMVILANEYTGSDNKSRWQMFGVKKGLTCTGLTCEKYSDDNMGGWAVTLTEEGAPQSGTFLYVEGQGGADGTVAYLATITDECTE